jgi:hypothetical protein
MKVEKDGNEPKKIISVEKLIWGGAGYRSEDEAGG